MDRKALLILHGKQAGNEAVRKAVMQRRKDGWDLAVRVTWEGGDAERYVREALELGYRTVIAGAAVIVPMFSRCRRAMAFSRTLKRWDSLSHSSFR